MPIRLVPAPSPPRGTVKKSGVGVVQDEKFGREKSGAATKRTNFTQKMADGRKRDMLGNVGRLKMKGVSAKRVAGTGANAVDENLKTSSSTSGGGPWMDMRRRAEMDLQLSVYVSGSANAARIAGRPTLLRNMFQDMLALRIVVSKLTE